MAQRTVIKLIDDITGEHIPDGGGQTIQFSIDGVSYEIDLTEENARKFYEALERYTTAARRVSSSAGARRASGATRSRVDMSAIREWARTNGFEVSDRGRIPIYVMDAYEQRNQAGGEVEAAEPAAGKGTVKKAATARRKSKKAPAA